MVPTLTMELMKSSFIIPFIKNNEKIKYILLKDNNGNLLHPIFTDLNEFAKLDPTLNYRILEFKEYLKIICNNILLLNFYKRIKYSKVSIDCGRCWECNSS